MMISKFVDCQNKNEFVTHSRMNAFLAVKPVDQQPKIFCKKLVVQVVMKNNVNYDSLLFCWLAVLEHRIKCTNRGDSRLGNYIWCFFQKKNFSLKFQSCMYVKFRIQGPGTPSIMIYSMGHISLKRNNVQRQIFGTIEIPEI